MDDRLSLPHHIMSLQDAATSRQEKLLALRQRKRAHESNGDGAPEPSAASKSVPSLPPSLFLGLTVVRCRSEVFKFRNYDPETGSARKHAKLGEDDTVEKAMEGEVDRVIAEDAVRRAEELVSPPSILYHWGRRRDGGRAMGSLGWAS